MKFGKFIVLFFLIYETSFYLVRAQMNNEEKNDCTKLYNYINGDSKVYDNSCCSDQDISLMCDDEGYITKFYK